MGLVSRVPLTHRGDVHNEPSNLTACSPYSIKRMRDAGQLDFVARVRARAEYAPEPFFRTCVPCAIENKNLKTDYGGSLSP